MIPRRTWWRLWSVVLVGLVVVAAGGGAWAFSVVRAVAPRAADAGSLGWKVEHHQRVNLLLLAHGGAGHDDPGFTDTVIVLSVRPGSGRAAVVSLPRFLLTDIPALVDGGVSGKLYTAYALGGQPDNTSLRPAWRTATGGGDLAAATVAEIIGEPIDGWVSVDVDAFRSVVDALGGIRVTLPSALDDPSYPLDGDSGRTVRIHFDKGPQLLDGTRALEYARSRLSTSERDRSTRQELVMSAILDRLRAVGVGPSLLPLLAATRQGVLTNLTLADLGPLETVLHRIPYWWERRAGSRLMVDDTNLLSRQDAGDGDYLLVPRDQAGLRAAIRSTLP